MDDEGEATCPIWIPPPPPSFEVRMSGSIGVQHCFDESFYTKCDLAGRYRSFNAEVMVAKFEHCPCWPI